MSIVSVGKHTYGHNNIRVRSWGEGYNVYIGNFCSIADNVTIMVGGNHRHDWVTTFPFGHIHNSIFNQFDGHGHPASKGNVCIGNDVWIGGNVTIMSGVTIGDGAVIAYNSHITKDIEPYTIVGGNPGKIIRKRFTDEQISALLKIKWWDWEDSKINNNLKLLCDNNIQHFIDVNLTTF
jgi:acetyltransferase-like isoleucine patch superfamily enzyme